MNNVDIQRILAATGYYKGGLDGDLGKLSRAAIVEIESQFDMSTNGWNWRRRSIAACQAYLNSKGFNAGQADGIYGDKTRHAYASWENKQPNSSQGISLADLMKIANVRKPTPSHRKTAQALADAFNKHCAIHGVTREQDIADLLAHVCVETGGFKTLVESLNYSVNGLLKTFPRKRISTSQANKFGRSSSRRANQKEIANCVYGFRMGNEGKKNAGWLFRGAGAGQCTGYYNFERAEKLTGIPFTDNPELMQSSDEGTQATLALWQHWGMNKYQGGSRASRKRWNGGSHGLKQYQSAFNRASKLRLSVPPYNPAQKKAA